MTTFSFLRSLIPVRQKMFPGLNAENNQHASDTNSLDDLLSQCEKMCMEANANANANDNDNDNFRLYLASNDDGTSAGNRVVTVRLAKIELRAGELVELIVFHASSSQSALTNDEKVKICERVRRWPRLSDIKFDGDGKQNGPTPAEIVDDLLLEFSTHTFWGASTEDKILINETTIMELLKKAVHGPANLENMRTKGIQELTTDLGRFRCQFKLNGFTKNFLVSHMHADLKKSEIDAFTRACQSEVQAGVVAYLASQAGSAIGIDAIRTFRPGCIQTLAGFGKKLSKSTVAKENNGITVTTECEIEIDRAALRKSRSELWLNLVDVENEYLQLKFHIKFFVDSRGNTDVRSSRYELGDKVGELYDEWSFGKLS